MNICDLTNSYYKQFIENKNRISYESTIPELFDYYYKFWAERSKEPVKLSLSELNLRKNHILNSLSRIKSALKSNNIYYRDIELVLMVGQNTSNGHAFYKNEIFSPWIAVECYDSQLKADIFVMHEIIHALHYNNNPDFFFKDHRQKDNTLRQLITEGIATLLTSKILNVCEADALWADYLPDNKINQWLSDCSDSLIDISNVAVESIESEKPTQLFVFYDPENILANRAGYYLGMEIMKSIAKEKNIKPIELLYIPRQELETHTLNILYDITKRAL